MNYAKFYSDTNKTLVESLVSFWVPGLREEQNYIRNLLLHKEPLMAPPVFQTIFPWKKSQETFLEHATRLHILDEDFVRALGNTKNKEFSFPLSRNPYTHQTESWNNLLNNKKTIVVTSGTGSGKTECFMLPVLQDIFRREKLQKEDGVQAIFIYPLNALMKNQKNRIDAWCRALNPKITYAIYNGDTPDDIAKSKSLQMEDAYPQLISRKQIRNNPPQILFSNPTMLNYMLVRPEDRPIIEKSKGKLRWILLDEAHTYSGSAAAELALQIRRILDAFDVSIEQVNFALTSATIGDPRDPKAKIKLKEFVGQITGKQISDISVIDGSRVIPELNEVKAQVVLDNINNAFNCKVSLQDVIVLRKKLNRKTYLSLKEIVQVFNKNIPRDKGLKLVDMLGDKKVGIYADGNDGALLPTRIHLFVRCISGMYVCTNPDCKTHKEGKISLGSLTTYQTTSCQVCKKPLLEVAVCPHCGGLLMIGEQSNSKNEKFRLKVNTTKLDSDIFDFVSDDEVTEADNVNKIPPDAHFSQFILAKEERVCPRINAREIFIRLDNEKSHFDIVDPESENTLKECFEKNFDKQVCPHCGGSLELPKLKYLRASATFMGRLLAPIVLKNAESSKDKGDVDMLYEGRKYITFTDSRQNTAKSAMSLNQDVERNWIRSAIYHKLSEIRIENFTPGGGLNESDEATYQALKNMQKRPKPLEEMFEDLQGRRSGQSPKTQPVAWEVLEHSLEKNESLKRMFKHLGEARLEGTVSGQDNTPLNYLRALYVDQFGWIPKHSNSLETLGMVKVVYPPLKFAKVPIKLAQHGFTDKDWHDYLKICLDYYIRGNRHYVISDSFKQFLTQSDFTSPIYSSSSEAHLGNKKVNKWQTVTMSDRGKVSERQNRLVLLLCAALGINSPSEMTQDYVDFVDDILQEAWKFLTQNVLEMTDIEHQGYKLDLMDKNKVCVQLFDKAFICPVDNVPIDTLFRGYSPRMNGFLSKANFERFKPSVDSEIEYPYFPYPQRRKKTKTGIVGVTDTEIYEWIDHKLRINKDKGLLSSLMVNIFLMHPIFIAGEHSGQQQREVLEKYESEFNKGHLNILSCSTTMEMGVDLKGISEVIMNDVPPKPSNYLQRAGRAGRRQETKALALTFCAPNPIGMSAWKNPGWSMDHLTEMGQVRLESIQIVQRQVNAFIFSKYVISRGGIKIRSSIDDFFGGEVSLCDSFCDFLDNISNHQKSYSDLIGEYQQLVKGTVLSTLVLEDAAYQCKKSLQLIKDIYNARITAFDKIIEDTEDASPRQRYAVTNRKKIFISSALMPWLAENNFLPSAGIPTGLVEFIPDLHRFKKDAKMPTMHLSQAISTYAPGNKIVINEWCYQISGITMKTSFEKTKKNVIQYCDHCHYATVVYGQPYNECPSCHHVGTMHGLKDMAGSTNFTEIVEPAGFTVDWSSKPTRVLKTTNSINFIQPILLEMEPWTEGEEDHIKFRMRCSTPRSEILFYNKGKGYGYALCPYCGRMEVETTLAGVPGDKHPLSPHRHLLTGKECQGNDNGGVNIRRNVLLVGRYQTDFVEIKFYDAKHHVIKDQSTLYSLGTILSRKLTEILGINEGEINFGYNGNYDSVFIYDTALGGSGYSPLLFDYKDQVFKLAYKALKNCDCDKACTRCLIDKNTQWYIHYLDRHKALEWLTLEVGSQEAPEEIKKMCPNVEKVTSDLHTEFYHLLRSNAVENVRIFVSNNAEEWMVESFPFAHNLKELQINGVDVTLCVNGKIDFSGMSADNLSATLSILLNTNVAYIKQVSNGIAPLFQIKMKNGDEMLYFCTDHYFGYNGEWGQNKDIYFANNFDGGIILEKIEKTILMNDIMQNSNIVFENYITSCTDTDHLIDTLFSDKHHVLEQIQQQIAHRNVQITYSDRYLKTPLGCIILSHMIDQLKHEFSWNISHIKVMLPYNIFSNNRQYGTVRNREMLTTDFADEQECDKFLEYSMKEIVGTNCEIVYEHLPHYRSLVIENSDFELSIRPDAGVAFGWVLDDRTNPEISLEEVNKNIGQTIDLYNFASRNGGILYTVAFKKKK